MKALFKNRFRYVIIWLVVLVALVNYIDRGALAFASEQIIGEYGFDKKDWGGVLGYFGIGYMFGSLIGGTLADRFGPKKVWLITGLAWSIVEVATGWSGDFGIAFLGSALMGFAMIRIIFGFTEGPAYSIINKTVSNWATSKERGFVVSIGLVSTPLGALLSAPVATGLLLLTDNWRMMFVVLGVAGAAIIVLVMMLFFTNVPRGNKFVTDEEVEMIEQDQREVAKKMAEGEEPGYADKLKWYHFFRSRTLVFNALGYSSFIYVNFLLVTWTPKYLIDAFGYNLKDIWYLAAIPFIGACFTCLIGGKISDYLFKKTGNLFIARSIFASVSLACTTTCFVSITFLDSPGPIIAMMAIANAFNALPNTTFWTVVIDTTPKVRVGTYSGISHFMANSMSVIAPVLTGYLVMDFGYTAMFIAASIMTVIGMGAMLFVRPGVLLAQAKI